MLKKKDSKKPLWKRLIKSTDKVNFHFSNHFLSIKFYSVNGLLLIGIILLLKVEKQKTKEKEFFIFFFN